MSLRLFARRTQPSLSVHFPRSRLLHTIQGRLLTIGRDGLQQPKLVGLWSGGSEESFVLVPPHISSAIIPMPLQHNDETYPLVFHHQGNFFAHATSTYPRLIIPHDLPRQGTSDISPATLFCFGVTHTIALDGTEDAHFTRLMMGTAREMKDVLEELKHR